MNKTIGRKEEIKLLVEAATSKKASLVGIYGRRGVENGIMHITNPNILIRESVNMINLKIL